MSRQIPGYHLDYRFLAVALSKEAAQKLLQEQKRFLFIHEQKIWLLPEVLLLADDAQTVAQFSEYHDYDVILLKASGQFNRYYSAVSDDCVLQLSELCNSNCIMCPSPDAARQKDHNIKTAAFLELLDCLPSDVLHITMTGGEPFMMGKGIFDIFRKLRDEFDSTEFLLLTNGRIFSSREYAEAAAETLPEHTTIGIPLHGYNAETHDRITRAPGSFQQTLIGIERLLEHHMCVELRVVISRLSAPYLTELARLIIEKIPGVRCVKMIGMEMTGNAAVNSKDVWIPYCEACSAAEPAIDLLIHAGIDVGIYNFPLCTVSRRLWPLCAKSISEYKIRYLEQCGNCRVRAICGGIFAGTVRLVRDEITAVEDDYA